MKKHLGLFILFLFTISTLIAQDGDFDSAPLNVEKAFAKKFPKAQSTVWEMDEDGNWEAEFKMDGKSYSSTYSEDGQWLITESSLKQTEIPPFVITSLNKKYQKYKITSAELVENAEGKWYEIELDRGDMSYEVMLDSKGYIVEEESDMEMEEEDDSDFDDDME